jgi:hypothetical protein
LKEQREVRRMFITFEGTKRVEGMFGPVEGTNNSGAKDDIFFKVKFD